jgi:hypothetical protein
MAVQEQTPYQEITANGVTTSFVLGFECKDKDHLIVTLDGVEPPVGNWSLTGGAVVFTIAPANGVLITIQRNTPLSRTTDYQSYNNSFRPGPVNDDFDWIWWKLQEIWVQITLLWAALNSKVAAIWLALGQEIQDRVNGDLAIRAWVMVLLNNIVDSGLVSAIAVTTVESVDDLQYLTKWHGRTVTVKSFHNGLNKGGGIFVFNQSKEQINDYGCIINGWERLDYQEVTAEMFGSVGDSVFDDTQYFKNFAAAKHNHKKAENDYYLTETAIFKVEFENSIIDLSLSTIIGTNFAYTPIQIVIEQPIQTLKIKAGNYDGENVVNGYIETISLGTGSAELIEVECAGIAKNFSNTKNTRSTFGYRIDVDSKIIKCVNPIVKNVYNQNGVSGSTGAQGVGIYNFTEQGIVNNFDIQGVYTNSVDADGISIFEKKSVESTEKAKAIVATGTIDQAFGRGVKSQCNLVVRDLNIGLSVPEHGIVNNIWRGVDAQLGNLDADNVKFDLQGAALFSADANSLFVINGSADGDGNQFVKNISIDGDSNIRYGVMLNLNNVDSINIDKVNLLSPQSNLNLLYVTADKQVKSKISITSISNNWSGNARLIFDTYLNKRVKNLVLEKIQWSGYQSLNVSMFDAIRVFNTNIVLNGTLAYAAIDKESVFNYDTDGTGTGGITYTNPNIPSWAKRYVSFDKGSVYSTFGNNVLVYKSGKFYQKTSDAPTEII